MGGRSFLGELCQIHSSSAGSGRGGSRKYRDPRIRRGRPPGNVRGIPVSWAGVFTETRKFTQCLDGKPRRGNAGSNPKVKESCAQPWTKDLKRISFFAPPLFREDNVALITKGPELSLFRIFCQTPRNANYCARNLFLFKTRPPENFEIRGIGLQAFFPRTSPVRAGASRVGRLQFRTSTSSDRQRLQGFSER